MAGGAQAWTVHCSEALNARVLQRELSELREQRKATSSGRTARERAAAKLWVWSPHAGPGVLVSCLDVHSSAEQPVCRYRCSPIRSLSLPTTTRMRRTKRLSLPAESKQRGHCPQP